MKSLKCKNSDIATVSLGIICHWQLDSCSRSPFHYSRQAFNDMFHPPSHPKSLEIPTWLLHWFYWGSKSHIMTHPICINCRTYILSCSATLIEFANENTHLWNVRCHDSAHAAELCNSNNFAQIDFNRFWHLCSACYLNWGSICKWQRQERGILTCQICSDNEIHF